MWVHKTPDPVCFNCPVKPKNQLSPFFIRKAKKDPFENVFGGRNQLIEVVDWILMCG